MGDGKVTGSWVVRTGKVEGLLELGYQRKRESERNMEHVHETVGT